MISLNGTNYSTWKAEMEDLLFVKEFYKPVSNEAKLEDMEDDQWEIKP